MVMKTQSERNAIARAYTYFHYLPLILFCAAICITLPCLAGTQSSTAAAPSTYVLGPDDQIGIRILQVPEISDKPIRIEATGNIELPFIGSVHAAGMTVPQLKAFITEALRTYIREPEVMISIEDYRSQPVSVIGAVNTPGVHQLRGHKNLIEVLSLAGGLRLDAGNRITITRKLEWGPIELPTAKTDSTGHFSIVDIDLGTLMQGRSPENNILIRPDDVISVPKARMVYVVGEVEKSGGFVVTERDTVSVLQALALAGGLKVTAAPQNSRVLRASATGGDRTEQQVDLRKLLTGKTADVSLRADDILFIPGSMSKRASIRAIEAAIQMGTGLVVWRR